jgi:hypothetical protein
VAVVVLCINHAHAPIISNIHTTKALPGRGGGASQHKQQKGMQKQKQKQRTKTKTKTKHQHREVVSYGAAAAVNATLSVAAGSNNNTVNHTGARARAGPTAQKTMEHLTSKRNRGRAAGHLSPLKKRPDQANCRHQEQEQDQQQPLAAAQTYQVRRRGSAKAMVFGSMPFANKIS